VEKRKLLRAIGLGVEFPRISLIAIGWKLIVSCLGCRCLTSGASKNASDPRANIPLIMPATAPPLPRGPYQHVYCYYLAATHRMHSINAAYCYRRRALRGQCLELIVSRFCKSRLVWAKGTIRWWSQPRHRMGQFFGISDPLESIAKHRYWEFGKRARPAKALNGN